MLLKQIGVCAGAVENYLDIGYGINQEPVVFDVAFPPACMDTGEFVRPEVRR